MAGGLPAPRLPGRHTALALGVATGRALAEEWRASGPYRWATSRPRPDGFAIQARDFRPIDRDAGEAILAGAVVLGGQSLAVGVRGDPWDRPSPSRAFAEALHRFDWLPNLIAAGPEGAAEALRLVLEWRRHFGKWNSFAWAPQIMARRVYHLACAGPALAARASEAETAQIATDLARQARDLLFPGSIAEVAPRAAAAAVAGAALRGPAGRRLLARALARLSRALDATVSADGGHAARRADLALELLFDLQTLDEALIQKGQAAPDAVQRAIDRLAASVRFATLDDGALTGFHGGRPSTAPYVAAARAQDETGDRPTPAELGGVQRMDSRAMQVVVDVAAPPAGAWALDAAAQPLGVEVLVGGHRLISGTGQGVTEGSTVEVGDAGLGRRLEGFAARVLGPRLVDADFAVEVQRHEAPGALWLELAHHGWMRGHGLMHQRRLYLDLRAGELRGEDRLTPTARAQGPDGRHFVPYALRFPLAPGVRALVSQDRRSVLLRVEGVNEGWILRNDTLDIALEPLARRGRPGSQLVLTGQRRADSGARVRWKLAPAQHPPASGG